MPSLNAAGLMDTVTGTVPYQKVAVRKVPVPAVMLSKKDARQHFMSILKKA